MNLTVLMNAGPWLSVPPDGYGGIETVVATLVPELRARGVRVVLATVGSSTLAADDYLTVFDEPQFRSIGAPYNSGVGHRARPHARGRSPTFASTATSTSSTTTSRSSDLPSWPPWAVPRRRPCRPCTGTCASTPTSTAPSTACGRVRFAAVSQSQLDRAPTNLREQAIGIVPLAVPQPPQVPPAPTRGDQVVVLARITRDKGQDLAAHACRLAGVPLVLAGPVAGISRAGGAVRPPRGPGRPTACPPGRALLPRRGGAAGRRRRRPVGRRCRRQSEGGAARQRPGAARSEPLGRTRCDWGRGGAGPGSPRRRDLARCAAVVGAPRGHRLPRRRRSADRGLPRAARRDRRPRLAGRP
ncbi:MAG: hypothetical protein WKF83_09970 [Nocardioidaceae bacterium]